LFTLTRTGLFHRAILMSGSGAAPWSLVEDPVHYAVKLAAALNCSLPANMLKNHLQLVDCLRHGCFYHAVHALFAYMLFL
jgi:hypothetical protein